MMRAISVCTACSTEYLLIARVAGSPLMNELIGEMWPKLKTNYLFTKIYIRKKIY